MANRLKMEQAIPVATWFSSHKDILLNHSQIEIARMVKADLGIHMNHLLVSKFEQAAGVFRKRGNIGGTRKDRVLIVARELARLMESMGVSPSTELSDIVNAS